MRRSWLSLSCISLVSALSAVAEPPLPPAANRQITLDVTVTDKAGKPIPGLDQQDFTLLDNKQPQKILSFKALGGADAQPPTEVILLIDEVNTNFTHVSYERDQVGRFLKQNGGELSVSTRLAFLSDTGVMMGNTSSRDGNALLGELDDKKSGLRVIGRSQGFYGADDRFELCIRAIQQIAETETAKPGRKLVVWISPGWPLLSGPNVELTSKMQQNLFHTIVSLSDLLRNAQITLYSVDPLGMGDTGGLRTVYYKTFLKGVKKPSQVQIGNLGLQVLADQSGGRVLNSSNDVAGEIATCVSDVSAFYEVTFDGLAGDGPDDYHALDMKVDKPGLTAHSRTGYYAQP